jgi:hypothetical protein
MSSSFRSSIAAVAGALFVSAVVACAPVAPDPEGGTLVGADEDAASNGDGISGSIPVGTTLRTTDAVNLRSGPATNRTILHVVPEGGHVVVQRAAPTEGFYRVKHDGTVGWMSGAYLALESDGAGDGDGDDDGGAGAPRDEAIARAKAAMGFSYWWGHGRFEDGGATSSTRGSCSGSCPDCSHSGQYGGDCSGLAAKVLDVPSGNTDMSDDTHPYSTADFIQNTNKWSRIDRSAVRKADALVYREGGAGHIFVYEKGDAWNQMFAYECRGCSSGCTSGYRNASSAYKAIRRNGW